MDDPIWITAELATWPSTAGSWPNTAGPMASATGLFESALARPRQLFAYSDPTPDVPTLAAAYAFAIAKNHAFIDGNKRTAAVVCETFLVLNGYELTGHGRGDVSGLPRPRRWRLGRAYVHGLVAAALPR